MKTTLINALITLLGFAGYTMKAEDFTAEWAMDEEQINAVNAKLEAAKTQQTAIDAAIAAATEAGVELAEGQTLAEAVTTVIEARQTAVTEGTANTEAITAATAQLKANGIELAAGETLDAGIKRLGASTKEAHTAAAAEAGADDPDANQAVIDNLPHNQAADTTLQKLGVTGKGNAEEAKVE